MKPFLLKLVLFAIIIFAVDRVIGYVMETAHKKVAANTLGKVNYICDYCDEDLLIFGSSRAEGHYNVRMIEDSLGISTYNCGIFGYNIIHNYGMLKLMIDRGISPKIVIYDVTPERDLEIIDNHQFLKFLKRRYNDEEVKNIILEVDSKEKYKMISFLYRHNSAILQYPFFLFNNKAITKNVRGESGYYNQDKPFDRNKIKPKFGNNQIKVDSIKLKMLDRFITCLKERSIPVIMIASPTWYGLDSIQFNSARLICKQNDIPFFDYSNDYKYVHHDEYFSDGMHMNKKGADEFTRFLINKIKIYLFDNIHNGT